MEHAAWRLSGDVLENCSCDVVCPGHFTFRNKCTHDYCHASWAFLPTAGRRGDVDLQGIGVVVVAATPPYMIDGDWQVALYIDESASGAQAESLEGIFTGALGGPWAVLARFVGRRLPARRVPVRFERSPTGRLRRAEIPAILTAEAEPLRGHDRASEAVLVNLHNTLYQPRHVIARGKFGYRDHGFDWAPQERGGHALLCTFDWSVTAEA